MYVKHKRKSNKIGPHWLSLCEKKTEIFLNIFYNKICIHLFIHYDLLPFRHKYSSEVRHWFWVMGLIPVHPRVVRCGLHLDTYSTPVSVKHLIAGMVFFPDVYLLIWGPWLVFMWIQCVCVVLCTSSEEVYLLWFAPLMLSVIVWVPLCCQSHVMCCWWSSAFPEWLLAYFLSCGSCQLQY